MISNKHLNSEKKMSKYCIFILSILFIQIYNSSNTASKSESETVQKSETCDGTSPEGTCSKKEEIKKETSKKQNQENPLIYSDIFIGQVHPNYNKTSKEEYGTIFDFSINKKIADYAHQYGMLPYPHDRFLGKQQGNFLHFMHLAYSKHLPLYFGVDQIIYPYIEITKDLQKTIMESGLYNVLHQFLSKVINYGKQEKYEQGILLYLSIALKFLDNQTTVIHDDVCVKLINNLLNIDKENKNTLYNFTLLNNKRTIDKLNFIQVYPTLRGSEKLKRISDCFRYLQNFEFVIEKELYTIYRIGELIHSSNEDKTYKQIKKFIRYIFNEEENVMNPLDIYLYIKKNYKNKTSSKDEINSLYDSVKEALPKNSTLKFMSNYTFFNKKEEDDFYKGKNSHVSLFSYIYTIDEFINYKLMNVHKLRFYPSFYEFIDIAHHGTLMRDVIFDRYRGKNRTADDRLYKYRDGIDMQSEFNYTRKAVKESMINEKDEWLNSYENSFNYLLNIVGHIDKKFKNNNNYKIRAFSTLIGSYVHFKQDILLFEQHTNTTCSTNGSLIDVYFENKVKFYETLQKVTVIFQKQLIDLIKLLDDKDLKIKLEQIIENKLRKLFISYENILKGIELQEQGVDNEERKKIKDSMIYYDNRTKQYQGWYTDLYRNNKGELNYVLKVYVNNFYMARPIKQVRFLGAILYNAMNYPEMGLVTAKDKKTNLDKMYIFSSYTGNEYPHGWADTINYEGLKEMIIKRK